MEPRQPADDPGEERLRLAPLTLPEARRRAIGERLEAAARIRQWRRRAVVAAGGAVALAAALALVSLRSRPAGDPPAVTRLRTGAGDFQLLPLGDRGIAFVSEGSDLEVHPGGSPALRLHRGSLHLVVQRRPGQPFVVATGAADVVVLGTEFDVTVAERGTEVSVIRGEVEVRNAHGRRRLWPKESARVHAGEPPRMVVPISSIVVDGPAEIVEPGR